jgi:hypothetical protein
MGDEEAPQCKVEYLDLPEGATEETNWIKRAGKCKVTYPTGDTFEGKQSCFDVCILAHSILSM